MTSIGLRAAVAASLLLAATPSHAADFIFEFGSDFSDPLVNNALSGTVTGRILGLADDGTSSALQIYIDSYPDPSVAFPVDVNAWFSHFENSFTVQNGMIVAASYHADDDFVPLLQRLYINVDIFGPNNGTNYASLGSNNATAIWNNQGMGGITFTRIAAVPEPSTWAYLLLGFGFAGAALRLRRARRAAIAA